ncbi:hypothetical protein DL766_002860 [Monosporascus sp. MC13-8B]|nr:hypothetical protein DL763_000507 [Monosporascus cannonballus]RYP34747.1 hypothetical protein DL766_002860 [Monosporascus sp. MC13-8B]
MLNKIAQKCRKSGQDPNVYGPDEIESFWDRFTFKELVYTWFRPFHFRDALIFICIQSFVLVYEQWGFNAYQVGLYFIPIGVVYIIACILFIPALKRNEKARQRKPDNKHAQYESRLNLLLWLAPCLPIGLIIFAWTSFGPPSQWIGTMFGSAIIGIANYAISMCHTY